MKTSLIAGLLLASLAMPAFAADDIPSIPTGPAYDWSGGYVGAIAGYGWVEGTDSFGNSSDFDGFLGGLHFGYNMQADQFVFGAELDASLVDASVTSVFNITTSTDWIGTARVRAGYAFDRALLFATAGVSLGGLEMVRRTTNVSDSNTHVGWVVGAGVEAFVTENISARLEYQHHDFGDETYNLGAANFQVDGKIDLVRFGVSYHF